MNTRFVLGRQKAPIFRGELAVGREGIPNQLASSSPNEATK